MPTMVDITDAEAEAVVEGLAGPICARIMTPGWFCTRTEGHDGPCALLPIEIVGGNRDRL